MTADQAYERGFLEARSRLLDLAAWLDRVDRAGAGETTLASRKKIDAALDVLRDGQADRAERIQALFSRPFDPQWHADFPPARAAEARR